MTERQAKKIFEFASNFYRELDFAHNLDHLNKTIQIARYIAERENADSKFIITLAAVHQFHLDFERLELFLKEVMLNDADMEIIIESVKFKIYMENRVESGQFRSELVPIVSMESRIAYDADTLQLIGPYGVIRELACNIKSRDMDLKNALIDARKAAKLYCKSLQTPTARKMIRMPNQVMERFWDIYQLWDTNSFS